MLDPIIRTEHLSRSFGAVKAVDDLTLGVRAGRPRGRVTSTVRAARPCKGEKD